MSVVDNLKDILDHQKQGIARLQHEISSLESSDPLIENENLKAELIKSQALLEQEKSTRERSQEENRRLKNALYEQLYNEKIALLNAVNRKIDVYYRSSAEGELNRLRSFEESAKRRIAEMTATLQANRIETSDEIYRRLEELKVLLDKKVTMAREQLARQEGPFSEGRAREFERLRQEQLTEEEVQGRVKQNNLESLIGLNIINKLGILLLIFGVIAASQFTYHRLPDIAKCVFIFAGGGLLLVIGEILNRRRPNVFSVGITSGGIAILYIALVVSYFGFGVLDMYPALGLCVLITVGALVLSLRYSSQTISAFALIGGYLPILSTHGDKTLVFGVMVYFVILNIMALVISVNKKWTVTAFIGFVLNTGGTIYIMSLLLQGRRYLQPFRADDLILLLYIVFAFVIYTLIPVASTYMKKLSFKTSDIVLLALNTVISALILYSAFYEVNLSDFAGLLAVIFALIYLALGRFVESRMTREVRAKALFYLTGLAFVVLVIPIQFGRVWLSLGWLAEGLSLLVYGILKEEKVFQRCGAVICGLCLAAFMTFDLINHQASLFVYKYLAITLGSLMVLAALTYKKSLSGLSAEAFKYSATVNLWFFLLYLIDSKLGGLLTRELAGRAFDADYLTFASMILVSFLIAYIIPRVRPLHDSVMKWISISIYGIALVSLLLLNTVSPIRGHFGQVPFFITLVGTSLLVLVSLLALMALRDLVLCLVMDRRLGIEWYPIIVSSYFVMILTQNLINHYHLAFNSAVISIIFVVTALAWIVFGFVKRYAFIRRFGLGLSILAVAKLFLIDLVFLTLGYKIISYFVFGITLVAISFVYQYFSKRIETISEVIADEKEGTH